MSQSVPNAAEASGERPQRTWVHLAAAAIGLSAFTFVIIIGNVAAGVPPQADENAWAHLFQLAMAAQLPLMVLFLATANWRQRRRVIILLAAQVVAASAAFGALAWSGY
jgi:cytochrome bd-type quinol oxidase subunit 2